jgi:hypothetical protein
MDCVWNSPSLRKCFRVRIIRKDFELSGREENRNTKDDDRKSELRQERE